MPRNLFLLLIISAIAIPNLKSAELNVFAASSLTDALKEIGQPYEEQTHDHIVFNFAASSMLARQIEEGAPADIFFSADEEKMDRLANAGLILPETRRDLLGNSLVVVAPNESSLQVSALSELVEKTQRLAVADPRTVPAGIYTRAHLSAIGLWEKLEPKLVPTENVRAALAAVESGNVDAGFVYKTDAGISKKVKVLFSVPMESGPTIRYPIALVKEAKDRAAADKFLRCLESDPARVVFEQFGFVVNH